MTRSTGSSGSALRSNPARCRWILASRLAVLSLAQLAVADPVEPPGAEAEVAPCVEAEPLASDSSPDALRDPVLSKILKRRILIDRPVFSLETGGKLQVQSYTTDSEDPSDQDDIFIRRLRPFFLGHLGSSWTWKFELELSAEVEAGQINLDQLDVRDLYFRFDGFQHSHLRLTLGQQKAPFSRDFMTSSTHLLLVERTFVGRTTAGVPGRAVGVHVAGDSFDSRLGYSIALGVVGHQPGAERLKFDSALIDDNGLNQGGLIAGRLDFHPRGKMTFFDGDRHSPDWKSTWSVAGYRWQDSGQHHHTTSDGISLDPERADLDTAQGIELSGGIRGFGLSLDWQTNRVRADTVVQDFTGGVYIDGSTLLNVAAIEAGYWFEDSPIELGAAVSRLDADGYVEAWRRLTLVMNLHWRSRVLNKLQFSHSWGTSRRGEPGADFQMTRIQAEYSW